ncbi:hypothetical protein [Bordetella sp. LUAb4]|uniref:hypothetical protein n=1 Tax=Bordetella sp. LUAb4 TaxID=2843195 RepID=UPI001E55D7F8|nr:hypothetical protein [Bordetella sp. LUAb4]
MLIRNAISLLGALILFSISPSPAWASHQYGLHILTDSRYFDTSKYYVKIFPPAGYPPNSDCMHTWHVPPNEVRLNATFTELTLYIEDKDSTTCGGEPKYNTWDYQIWKYQTINGAEQRVGLGSFQFYHYRIDGEWYTSIIPRNLDGMPMHRPSVGIVTCHSNKLVKTNCRNKPTQGKDAADNIYIYFRWPVNEDFNL